MSKTTKVNSKSYDPVWVYTNRYPSGYFTLNDDGSTSNQPIQQRVTETKVTQTQVVNLMNQGNNLASQEAIAEGFSNKGDRDQGLIMVGIIVLLGVLVYGLN